MRGLLRFYPAPWRARYGEEFEVFLEEQQVSLGNVLNVLLGALDAHLERGKGGSTVATRLRTPPALAISAGSLLWLSSSLAAAQVLPAGGWVLVVGALGMFVVAVGIMGLGLLHERPRSLTIITAGLAAVGLVLSAAIEVGFLVGVLPWFGNPPTWPTAVAVAGLAAEAGFAVAAIASHVLPRIPLAAIGILSVALGIGAYAVPGYVLWGAVLLAAAWLALGLAILVTPAERVAAA
jgi:hypothetical protein